MTYFKESWQELEKVTWPNRQTATKLTIVVIVMAGLMGGFIAAVDFGLIEVLQNLILGL
ncbi:MAG: preprotein translocase subunit SecE [Candidatus Saccharimonadales bacterium]